jgi:hypothetical protein
LLESRVGLPRRGIKLQQFFVDHFSSLSYVYLQKSTNAEETLAAKILFK